MRAWLPGLFDNDVGRSVGVELDHAVGFRLAYFVRKDRGSRTRRRRLPEHGRKPVAVKDVVSEHQGNVVVGYELSPDDEGLRQPVGPGLLGISDREAPLLAVAQQPGETRLFC